MAKPANIQLILGMILGLMPLPVFAAGEGDPAGLRPGSYELRNLDDGTGRRICVRNERDLVQIRHRGQACEHYVVQAGEHSLSVHYTCQGKGWGLTRVRGESRLLGQLESQGIIDGSPFALRAELRYKGDC